MHDRASQFTRISSLCPSLHATHNHSLPCFPLNPTTFHPANQKLKLPVLLLCA